MPQIELPASLLSGIEIPPEVKTALQVQLLVWIHHQCCYHDTHDNFVFFKVDDAILVVSGIWFSYEMCAAHKSGLYCIVNTRKFFIQKCVFKFQIIMTF